MYNVNKFLILLVLTLPLVLSATACSKSKAAPAVNSSETAEASSKQNVSGTSSFKNGETSERTIGLIQKLKVEDAKLSDKTLPADISNINEACHEIFNSIMSQRDSIGLESDDILDTNSNMYIKIGNIIKIDNTINRLVEFGKKKPAEGSSTKVYIQSFDDKNVLLKEVLNVYTNSNNVARIGPSDIYNYAGKYYAVIPDLMFDVDKDRDYIRFTSIQWVNNSWENVEIADSGDYKNPFINKDDTYSLESIGKGLRILIKNSDGKIINHRLLNFTARTPTIELFSKDLPNDKVQVYEISKTTYRDKNVKISYPQLKNMNDTSKQKIINDKIKNEALKGLNYYGENISSVTLDVDYSIEWKGQRLLSIQYSGIGNVQDAAHPNSLFYSTNINLINGSVQRLKDLVIIDNYFVEKFKNGEYRIIDSQAPPQIEEAAKGIRDELTAEALIKMFNNADSLDSIGTENQSDTFTYFTKDSLGIVISVPHAVGDYAEFLMNYKDMEKNIRANNEIWVDFSK